MIVDVHAYFGKWPHWPVPISTPTELIGGLDLWGIHRAVVCSTRGIFVNWEDGNQETAEAIRRYSERLSGFVCLGPPVARPLARPQLDFDSFQASGFRGFRLYPQHHSYHPLFAPFVDSVCEEAAARQWPLLLPLRMLMNWGMPTLDPVQMATLIERHPATPWILAGFNYLQELQVAVALMRRFPAVYLETSCIQGFNAVANIVEECGSDRLLLGSGVPFQSGVASVEKILRAHISEPAREAVLGLNAIRLLKLKDGT